MSKIYTAIGLMSGTSMDGVDVALISTDGEKIQDFGPSNTYSYPDDLKSSIAECVASKSIKADVETQITEFHAHIVKGFLSENNISYQNVDVVGFHGHTVFHDPDNKKTVQMGDGKLLADLLGIDVVNDLRSNDVENGGQGAPLVPVYHKAIFDGHDKPIAVINIGGVANITYICANGELVAFDTGPGNAIIDDLVSSKYSLKHDYGGEIAASGKIDKAVLGRLLENKYFAKKPPKSLDRNDFDVLSLLEGLRDEDAVATITEFSAKSIAMAIDHLKDKPTKWVITGGGRHNKTLMSRIASNTGSDVVNINDLGFDGDALEAQAFAYLAVRSINKMPLTYPTTTGVAQPVSGGVFCQA